MGWLGWSEEQTLNSSISAILTAYEGRREMLNAIFGDGKPTGEPVSASDPSLFKDLKRMAIKQMQQARKNGETGGIHAERTAS